MRPVLRSGAAALLAALVVAGCGGGAAPTEPPAASGAALVAAQPGQLAAYVVQRLRLRQASPLTTAAAGGAAPTAAAAGDTLSASATLVQEAGVDEADRIKTAAGAIYALQGQTLRRDRLAADGRLEPLQTLALPPEAGDFYTELHGLHLAEDTGRLVALGTGWQMGQWQGGCGGEVCPALASVAGMPSVPRVLLLPVALGETMTTESRLVMDGRLVGSRRIGQKLLLVTVHQPALAADALPAGTQREAALAALSAADVLPRVRIGGAAPVPLVDEAQCYLQPGNGSPSVEITTITVLDLASPTLARQSRCFVGGTEAMYMAPDALYLATSRSTYAQDSLPLVYPTGFATDLHRFDIGGTLSAYVASGSVDGHLGWDEVRKPWRFSQWNGDLRVLSFTGRSGWAGPADAGSTPPSPATLTVLRQDGDRLVEVSRLPNAQRPAPLGKPDEQVFGVRFVEDRGYVVTFRTVDPLYVLDLANPADPRTTGELELSGFSQDLVPMGPGWLLGIGRETDAGGAVTGLKLALFDVRDPAAPRLQRSEVLGGPASSTALDRSRQGLNLAWRDGVARAALPVLLVDETGVRHGLQRLEVDPAAATLVLKPLLPAAVGEPWPDIGLDRSLQFGDRIVWLTASGLDAFDW